MKLHLCLLVFLLFFVLSGCDIIGGAEPLNDLVFRNSTPEAPSLILVDDPAPTPAPTPPVIWGDPNKAVASAQAWGVAIVSILTIISGIIGTIVYLAIKIRTSLAQLHDKMDVASGSQSAPPTGGGKPGGPGVLPLIVAFACLIGFTACTTLYDRTTGKPIARFMGDMDGSHYQDGTTTWDVDHVRHSVIYTAAGSSAGNVVGTAFAGATGLKLAGAAVNTGPNFVAPLAPAAATFFNRPTSRATPTPTPGPVAVRYHH